MSKRYYEGASGGYKRRGLSGGGYVLGGLIGNTGVYRRRHTSGGIPGKYRGKLRRGGFYGRYGRGGQMARIRRGLNVESKFLDTALSFGFDTTLEVPATGQLTLIPQGVTESTRVGRSCQLRSIQIRGSIIYSPGADTTGADIVYLWLVQDKQCNGAAAAVTDVVTTTLASTAMVNLANSDRFKIWRKWCIPVQAGAGVSMAYGKDMKPFEFFTKLNVPIEYDSSATTGAIGTIRSNNFFLMAGDTSADDEVGFNGTCRLRFTDL